MQADTIVLGGSDQRSYSLDCSNIAGMQLTGGGNNGFSTTIVDRVIQGSWVCEQHFS